MLDHVEEEPDGDGYRLTFGTDSPRHVAEIVTRAAGEASVLAPDSLRRLVFDGAQRALSAYE
jgi:predicted DNA-binding transcriptional regulator YafY